MLGNHLRNIKRWNQILRVLTRYGFVGFLRDIGLGDVVRRILGGRSYFQAETEILELPVAARLRRVMEDLGPTFIKLGQVLSTRRDIVPDEWADEFAKLQSDCPRVPYEEIEELLRTTYAGKFDELFQSVDPDPIAAASMAQAHRATLANGDAVVLKILRPGIRDMIAGDMDALRFLAKLAEEHLPSMGFDPVPTVEEFARELSRETDLTNEGRATERLARMFEDDERISFPTVFWDATTKDVLCESVAPGDLLADVQPEALSSEVRRAIVTNGSRAVFHQTLEVGFFHADPHPGNIFYQPDGSLTFIDCGMTGFVDEATRLRLAEIVYGVVKNDPDMVMRAALLVADADPDSIDLRAARSDVQQLVGRFVGVPLERIDLGGVLDEFFQTLRRHDLRCPPDIVLLIKAMGTIEGVATKIDPTFDLVGFTQPYIEKLLKSRFSPKAVARRVREVSMELVNLAETAPGEISSLFRRLRKNRFRVQLDLVAIEDLVGGLEDASERLSYAVLIAALVVASSVLVLASRGGGIAFHLGVAGFVVSATLAFVLLASGWLRRRRLRRLGKRLRKARGERN